MISDWLVSIHTHLRDKEKETQLAKSIMGKEDKGTMEACKAINLKILLLKRFLSLDPVLTLIWLNCIQMISGWIVLIHTHLRDKEKETQLAARSVDWWRVTGLRLNDGQSHFCPWSNGQL